MSETTDDRPQGNFLRAALEEAGVEPLLEESIKEALDAEGHVVELMYTKEEWDELTKNQPGGQVGSTVYLDEETLF